MRIGVSDWPSRSRTHHTADLHVLVIKLSKWLQSKSDNQPNRVAAERSTKPGPAKISPSFFTCNGYRNKEGRKEEVCVKTSRVHPRKIHKSDLKKTKQFIAQARSASPRLDLAFSTKKREHLFPRNHSTCSKAQVEETPIAAARKYVRKVPQRCRWANFCCIRSGVTVAKQGAKLFRPVVHAYYRSIRSS